MASYHFNFGTYEDSYLVIRLNIFESLEKLKELDPVDQALFFHEYTHFLQNITGVFGRNHIWQTYDRIRQVISSIQKENPAEIIIALRNEESGRQRKLNRITNRNTGKFGLPDGMDDSTAVITGYSIDGDNEMDEIKPGNNVKFVTLQISDGSGSSCEYRFGDIAVAETMSYLMEYKHFKSEWDNFPYKSCFLFSKLLGLDLEAKPELMFAICDAAMFSSYPGWMFHEIIMRMLHVGFIPENPEDIYQFAFDVIKDNGMDVWHDLEQSRKGIHVVLERLLANGNFKETLDWLKYILDSGYEARKQNMFFMLHAYREPNLFEGFWQNVVAQFGTPQIINAKNERVFSAPFELKSIEGKIDPVFLLGLKQLNETLISAKTSCELYDIYRKNTNGLEVDKRCLEAPWERSNDQIGCAFTIFWANFGLSEREVKIVERE